MRVESAALQPELRRRPLCETEDSVFVARRKTKYTNNRGPPCQESSIRYSGLNYMSKSFKKVHKSPKSLMKVPISKESPKKSKNSRKSKKSPKSPKKVIKSLNSPKMS
jgi:hypothetical protein